MQSLITTRRLNKLDNELTVYANEYVLIVDNGCDQTIIALSLFVADTFTGLKFSVSGAMASMHCDTLELVNDAYTLATLDDGSQCIFKINQCLCDTDPHATNSLL